MTRPRTVIYGRLAFAGMLLLALESVLGFGAEVRAAIISLTGLCLYRSDANARQWNARSEDVLPPADVRQGPLVDP